MKIGLFEQQMTRIIPSFAGFTEFTTSIPKLYWDVKSQEQRILAICKMLNKVICYADMLGENVDEIAKTLQDIEDGKLDPVIESAIAQWFEDNQPAIAIDIAALQDALPIADFNAENTVKDAIDAVENAIDTVKNVLPLSEFNDVNTVKKYIDDNIDEITDALPLSEFDSEETVKKYIDDNVSKINDDIDVLNNISGITTPILIGRSVTPDNHVIQSCCASDEYIFMNFTDDDNNTNVTYKYDILDGTYVASYNTSIGHSNSMAYNKTTDLLYNCTARDHYIQVISPDTFQIVSLINLSVIPHSIAIDPITQKAYITVNNYPLFTVYEMDYNGNLTELFSFNSNIQKQYNFVGSGTQATQSIAVYNGEFYYCVSYEVNNGNGSCLIKLDTNGNALSLIPINSSDLIYKIREVQSGYFDENGNYFYCARGVCVNNNSKLFGIMYGIPIYGNMLRGSEAVNGISFNVHYSNQGENSLFNPFSAGLMITLEEAFAQASMSNGTVTLDTDANFNKSFILRDKGYLINIGAHTLTINASMSILNLRIDGSGSIVINDKYVNYGQLSISNAEVTGKLSGEHALFMIRSIANTSSLEVNLRNSSFITYNPGSAAYLTITNPPTSTITIPA